MGNDYPRFVEECNPRIASAIHASLTIHKNQRVTIIGMDYKKEIGKRIRESRLEKGWTLVELSRRTKDLLSNTRISNYETGERMPSPSDAVILGSALGKRPAYLMAVDDVQLPISPQEEALIKFWRALPENERMEYFRSVESRAMIYRDPVQAQKMGKEWTAPKTRASRPSKGRISRRPAHSLLPHGRRNPAR